MTFRCRIIAPTRSEPRDITADTPEQAANDMHADEVPHGAHRGIAFVPDEAKPGARIYFARVEVEGHGEMVSRIYASGIVRRGGVKSRPTLAEIARAVRWDGAPEELIEEGWMYEEAAS